MEIKFKGYKYKDNSLDFTIKEKEVNGKQPEELIDFICKRVIEEYEDKIKDIPEEVSQEFEKVITLQVVDNYWMEHINTMSNLREGRP